MDEIINQQEQPITEPIVKTVKPKKKFKNIAIILFITIIIFLLVTTFLYYSQKKNILIILRKKQPTFRLLHFYLCIHRKTQNHQKYNPTKSIHISIFFESNGQIPKIST